ncbi:hypothetical protein [Mucilaginibacter celer]|uniref:Uncharacterized protein n=1 Tax=Mucilaginibacter celer TaxID=2305508 RepID=A0A494VSA9_9SPHI|nr:hypothetical protein [Mucilaginibacter celer]AYL94255.1 hypothetical protein HYN43_002625 [Mucilaginibacter celer]
MNKILALTAIILVLGFTSCDHDNNHSATSNTPKAGELDTTFRSAQTATQQSQAVNPEPVKTPEEQLKDDGWEQQAFRNGIMPDCYNYHPSAGDLDNSLIVHVGSGTDVAIKVMSLNTNTCVRYVFINSGSTYTIRNLPEDEYYVKIAYGKDWISKTVNDQCLGKFMHQSMYKRGEERLDFNRRTTIDGYIIPSFELSLDVVANEIQNSFTTDGITEEEFNN